MSASNLPSASLQLEGRARKFIKSEGLQNDRAVHLVAGALLLRDKARPFRFWHVVGRVVHFERVEDVLTEIVFELLARDDFDQPADHVSRHTRRVVERLLKAAPAICKVAPQFTALQIQAESKAGARRGGVQIGPFAPAEKNIVDSV